MSGRFVIVLAVMAKVFQIVSGDSTATIKTFAGGGTTTTSAVNEVAATSAYINQPAYSWRNPAGTTYVCDFGFKAIRTIDTSGIIHAYFGSGSGISTIAGNNGQATSATGTPYSVWGDTMGNIYFDENRQYVRKIDGNNIVTAFFGSAVTSATLGGIPATSAYLGTTMYVALVDTVGNFYAICQSLNQIKKVPQSTMIVSIFAGTGQGIISDTSAVAGDGGPVTSARVFSPLGAFLDTMNNLYFNQNLAGYIRKVDLATGIVTRFAGGTGAQGYTGDFGPATAALLQSGTVSFVQGDSAGDVYFSAYANHNVRVIDSTGIIGPYAGTSTSGFSGDGGPPTSAQLNGPRSIFCDGANVYVADITNNRIRSVPVSSGSVLGVTYTSTGTNTAVPTLTPSVVPTVIPSVIPSVLPTIEPSVAPSSLPTLVPTLGPTVIPSILPSIGPTVVPTTLPTVLPSLAPSVQPTVSPSLSPTLIPTICPSVAPSVVPTLSPTVIPTVGPSSIPTLTFPPTAEPSIAPTCLPTAEPSISPSVLPTVSPSILPTAEPSSTPTQKPTVEPSFSPTVIPTTTPTIAPTVSPSVKPSVLPTVVPTVVPTIAPTVVPTISPSVAPTVTPTVKPTLSPSVLPTISPTVLPTILPTLKPTVVPTIQPTVTPTVVPSIAPTVVPTIQPTQMPTVVPTVIPTVVPTVIPSIEPSVIPTVAPTEAPTVIPTTEPSQQPSELPSEVPTVEPTTAPSQMPTIVPTIKPTVKPTVVPTIVPSVVPTITPTVLPTEIPSVEPSLIPTQAPTVGPSHGPIGPTNAPTVVPTTAAPSVAPTLDYVDITFDTDIYLHNVTVTVLDSASQTAVAAAVAQTLAVSYDHVAFLSQTFIGSEFRRRRLFDAYQLLVKVNVWASTRDYEFATNKNASFLYHSLSSTLINAVDTNAFSQTIRETSAIYNASGTLFVGRVNLTVTDYTVVTPTQDDTESDSDDKVLSDGAIAGIVIGGVVFMILVMFCCYYWFGAAFVSASRSRDPIDRHSKPIVNATSDSQNDEHVSPSSIVLGNEMAV